MPYRRCYTNFIDPINSLYSGTGSTVLKINGGDEVTQCKKYVGEIITSERKKCPLST